eukprot:CAMPEP_0168605598 /NCGR_PEP_ID=MMETSP0420-20121227/16075_1 /TAXON_ID=498008 /ORGANISM="Pessonella sp." /LENGTH=624 /DNA_ID=CAMNT_0008645111 /DNA_START=212 /DNA_END=2083 /DNA_ORIENTATION=-
METLEAEEVAEDIAHGGFPIFKPLAFRPYSWQTYKKDRQQIFREVLAGITVAFALIPESVSFAFLAGVAAGARFARRMDHCIITAVFGSRPAMICGATGVHAAVLVAPIKEFGLGVVPWIVIFGGVITMISAAFRVAKFVRLIPITVMQGFTNGLAIIIAMSQAHAFQVSSYEYPFSNGEWLWNWTDEKATTAFATSNNITLSMTNNSTTSAETIASQLPEVAYGPESIVFMILLVLVTIVVIHFMPKVTKLIPSAFVALALSVALEQLVRLTGFRTPLIFFWNMPLTPLTFDLFLKLLWPSFSYFAVGMVELLLTIELVREKTETPTVNPNQMVFVVGVAIAVSGLFGTMGGGSTIGMLMINTTLGANGRYRISAIVAAVGVFIITTVLSVVVDYIPLAALVGVMIIVVVHTFNWGSLWIVLAAILPRSVRQKKWVRLHRKIKRIDAAIIVLSTVLTVIIDLFVGAAVGVVLATFAFSWESSKKLIVDSDIIEDEKTGAKKKIYMINGPLFFGTVAPFMHFFTYIRDDPDEVEIHLQRSSIYDYSGVDALNELGAKYKECGKTLHVKNLNVSSTSLIRKMDHLVEHFTYHIDEDVDNVDEVLDRPLGLNVTGHGVMKGFDPVN